MSDSTTVALLVFARVIEHRNLLKKHGKDAVWLCNSLKPIVVEKLTNAGILIKGALASVIEKAGKLTLFVAGSPVLCVCLLVGTSVLVQLGLEVVGHKTSGRVAGALGVSAAGGVAAFFMAPAVLPVAAGVAAGFGVWSAVDRLREMYAESEKIVHCHNVVVLDCKG